MENLRLTSRVSIRAAVRALLAAVLVALSAFVAACGGTPGSTATAPPAASNAPAEPTAAPGTTTGSATSSAGETAVPASSPVASDGQASATLACSAPATPTPSQTEGPYFTPGSPQKASLLEPGMAGTPLTLTGYVVATDCTPLANAKVDVWQANAEGVYDNSGYTLRGHVFTDADGRFAIETIIPGQYPGRTEHIHVKVTPDGGAPLTTQLYFPGSTANEADNIFSPELLLDLAGSGDGYTGTITFVLEA